MKTDGPLGEVNSFAYKLVANGSGGPGIVHSITLTSPQHRLNRGLVAEEKEEALSSWSCAACVCLCASLRVGYASASPCFHLSISRMN